MNKFLLLMVMSVITLSGCSLTPQVGDTKVWHFDAKNVKSVVTATVIEERTVQIDSVITMKKEITINKDVMKKALCTQYKKSITETALHEKSYKGYYLRFDTRIVPLKGDVMYCMDFTLHP